MNKHIIHLASSARRKRTRANVRAILVSSTLAGLLFQGSGCVGLPRRKDASTIPPAVPQSANGLSPAEVAKANDPRSEFHKTATDRQRLQVHLDFGRIFEAQGDFDGAVLEYQDALTVLDTKGRGEFRAADHAVAHRRMGAALDRLGRFAQAEVHYKKAIRFAPRDPKAWNDVGYSYYLQSRYAEAERALRTALRFAPQDERIRTNLGLTLAAGGQAQAALPLLSQTGGDAIGHANLGYLLASSGQLELARHHYEQALAQRPDLELARRALAQIERQQAGQTGQSAPDARVAAGSGAPAAPVDPGVGRASMPTPAGRTPPRSVSPAPPSAPAPARSRGRWRSRTIHGKSKIPPPQPMSERISQTTQP
jgi:Flp pilus assembly protein TadD